MCDVERERERERRERERERETQKIPKNTFRQDSEEQKKQILSKKKNQLTAIVKICCPKINSSGFGDVLSLTKSNATEPIAA